MDLFRCFPAFIAKTRGQFHNKFLNKKTRYGKGIIEQRLEHGKRSRTGV